MRKSIKAIVCAVSALVICAAPNIANYAGITTSTTAITAEAGDVTIIKEGQYKYAIYKGLKYQIGTNFVKLAGRYGYVTEINVPATIPIDGNDVKVTEVLSNAFVAVKDKSRNPQNIDLSLNSIKKVDLSKCRYLKKIPNYCFQNMCLKELVLPTQSDNGISIGDYAFCNTKIGTLTFSKSLDTIYSYQFVQSFTQVQNINMSDKAFEDALAHGYLKKFKSLEEVNGYQLFKKDVKGKPYFDEHYKPLIEKYSTECDYNNITFMNKYIDAMVKYVVKTETSRSMTDEQKVRKLHDWVCKKVNYAYLPGTRKPDETWANASDSTIFMKNKAICEGYARGFELLLQEAGIESYVVQIPSVHAWNIVKLNGQWYNIDTCHDDGRSNLSHYLKSDTEIQRCKDGHAGTKEIQRPYGYEGNEGYTRIRYASIPSTCPECPTSWKK